MKYSKRELFAIRWMFREKRKGVFNSKRLLWKIKNICLEDCC